MANEKIYTKTVSRHLLNHLGDGKLKIQHWKRSACLLNHLGDGKRTINPHWHIDVLLNSMTEKELVVIEATAEGIKKARETEVPE